MVNNKRVGCGGAKKGQTVLDTTLKRARGRDEKRDDEKGAGGVGGEGA